MEKICPNCGETFFCSHSADCWCSSIKISEKLSLFLKDNFSGCLCKNCLEKFVFLDENNKDKKNNN